MYNIPMENKISWTKIYRSSTHDITLYSNNDNEDHYRIKYYSFAPKYFKGESAWMDVQRFIGDLGDYGAYDIFH